MSHAAGISLKPDNIYTLSISCRSFPGMGNSSELRSLMADILDVALETAVDSDATCGASVSLCSACVMSARLSE